MLGDTPGRTIVAWAAPYVGIPFQTGGSARTGCDCWGLLALAYREVFGIDVPLYGEEYDNVNDLDRLARIVRHHLPSSPWRQVPLAALRPGDGLLFRIAGHEVHVGLSVGGGRFLHARSRMAASCIERLDSPAWSRRVLGAYRYGQ